MAEASNSKVNTVRHPELELGPLPNFELFSQKTNDRLNKGVGSSEENNYHLVVYGGNTDDMDEDIDEIEEVLKSIENKKIAEKLKKGEGTKEKKEKCIKEKKKSTKTLYNRCYTNKMITEFEKIEENKHIKKIDVLKIFGFFGITKMKLRRIHSEFIIWMCDNFIPIQ
ncbi:hypothetical protein LIER_19204 [Lithospermum erythrorhizon]|uniref:Uncharacterized protein n=1 Tax=Lithospermum erythrorhizon TaxID=34254 RepID=A0AAV3QJ64_LITER